MSYEYFSLAQTGRKQRCPKMSYLPTFDLLKPHQISQNTQHEDCRSMPCEALRVWIMPKRSNMMGLCSTQNWCAEKEKREMNTQILLPKLRSTLPTDLSRSSSSAQQQKCISACHKTTKTRITQFGEGLREICTKQKWSAGKKKRNVIVTFHFGLKSLRSIKNQHQGSSSIL